MTDLRTAAMQALEAMRCGVMRRGVPMGKITLYAWDKAMSDLDAALAEQAEPVEPVQAKFDEVAVEQWKLRMVFYDKNGDPLMSRQPEPDEIRAALEKQAELVEPVQEPYTGDVTRIMRDAGMTFHLGLPHKAVVEQMTRVVDLVYAEASIKAAQQFAAALAQQAEPVASENYRLGLEASIQRVTVAMQKTTIASLMQQRAELVRACRQALQAIEQGAPFDHLDNVVAPELRRATEGIDE